MQSLINPGDTVSKTYGEGMSQLTIRTDLHHDGVSIQTYVGGQYNSILSRTFTHSEIGSARVFYAHIRDCASAGKPVYAIEWEIAALIAASVAVDVEQVAAAINADGAAYVATETAIHNQVVRLVAETVPDRQGWHRERQQSRAAITSQAMDRIITDAAHSSGRIVRSREATSTQLVALNKRGLVELQYGKRGNTRVIAGARLTAKGFKHAAVAA